MYSISSYNGHRLIKLQQTEQDSYPFVFGYVKAKLILDNIKAIRAFAAEEERANKSKPVPAARPKARPPRPVEEEDDGVPF